MIFLSCKENASVKLKKFTLPTKIMETKAKMFPPKSQRPSAKAIPTLLGSTPSHPTESTFEKEKLPDGIILPSAAIAPRVNKPRSSAKQQSR
jgi:hypothetical protein